MPVVWGRKSESEKFAGALRTYSIEALMGDGKALQAGTSHNLGQHFATAYGIEFLDKNQQRALPWSTSWGTSTRMIGGLIMTHGDDAGPDPPAAGGALPGGHRAHPAAQGRRERGRAAQGARGAGRACARPACACTSTTATPSSPGFKYADWEMRGVPLRLEIGPKDIEKDQCVLVRRDTREKAFVPLAGLAAASRELLDAIQARPPGARAAVRGRQHDAASASYDEFKQVMADKRGFLVAGWCRSADCEARIKEETKATVRVIPIEGEAPAAGACVRCGAAVAERGLFRAGLLMVDA